MSKKYSTCKIIEVLCYIIAALLFSHDYSLGEETIELC